MSPAGLSVTSVTWLPFPSNWFLDNTSAINCIPGLGLPDQIRSMTQLTEYLLWQSSAPAVPEEDQNIPLVDSHDIISPLGRFLSVPELQNILGEYQKTDTCYFIALSKVTLNVHKDMNFFFLSGTQLHTLPCCHFAAVVSAGCMKEHCSDFLWYFLSVPWVAPLVTCRISSVILSSFNLLYLCHDLIFILAFTVSSYLNLCEPKESGEAVTSHGDDGSCKGDALPAKTPNQATSVVCV